AIAPHTSRANPSWLTEATRSRSSRASRRAGTENPAEPPDGVALPRGNDDRRHLRRARLLAAPTTAPAPRVRGGRRRRDGRDSGGLRVPDRPRRLHVPTRGRFWDLRPLPRG